MKFQLVPGKGTQTSLQCNHSYPTSIYRMGRIGTSLIVLSVYLMMYSAVLVVPENHFDQREICDISLGKRFREYPTQTQKKRIIPCHWSLILRYSTIPPRVTCKHFCIKHQATRVFCYMFRTFQQKRIRVSDLWAPIKSHHGPTCVLCGGKLQAEMFSLSFMKLSSRFILCIFQALSDSESTHSYTDSSGSRPITVPPVCSVGANCKQKCFH